MASSRGSLTQQLIVGVLGVSTGVAATLAGIRSTATDPQSIAAFSGDMYMITADNATPSIRLDLMPAITFQADGDVELGSGDLVFGTRNARPLLVDGTKAFLGSDRVTMSRATSTSNQPIAAALNPFSGSGLVLDAVVICRGTPNSMTADLVVATTATASGTVIRNNISISTGAWTRVYTGTLLRIPQSQYISLVSTSGSTVTQGVPDCDLIPYWVQF